MMVYRLRARKTPDGSVNLTLGYGWRAFFAVVAVVTISAIIHEGQLRGLMPFVAAVALFAAVYQESWSFDRSAGSITSRIGVIFLTRTRRYPLSDLHRIIVRIRAPYTTEGGAGHQHQALPQRRTGVPYSVQRGYVQLILEFSRGGAPGDNDTETPLPVVIQTESLKNREHLQALAVELSEALQVPLDSTTR